MTEDTNASELERIIADARDASFANMVAPQQRTCACGAPTWGDKCEPCLEAAHIERSTRKARESIPSAYRWSRVDAPELQKRVNPCPHLGALSEAILGRPLVVFVGPAGSGKTSLAVAMFQAHLASGRSGSHRSRFAHSYILSTARAQTKLGQGEAEAVEEAIGASLLLLDDIGNKPETVLSAVQDVVFNRHANERPTWFTTAFTQNELAVKYGDGTARRIYERALVVRLGAKEKT